MNTKDDRPEPKIPEDVCISCPEAHVVRLLGSHSSRLPLRRRPNGGPEPEIPPPPPVSTPDLALQFSPCLESIPSPPDVDLEAAVIDAVQEAFGANADVRYRCLSGRGTLGVWLRPSTSTSDSEARARGLDRIDILRSGENFAFFENASLIRRSARDTWDNMPKRLNGDGQPDTDGPIHLTGLSISFRSPDRILTIVDGFDERPWPDVDFRLTITDTLSVLGGDVQCHSSRDLDVDTSWLNFLTGLFLLVFPPLGIVFLVQRIIIATVDTPSGEAGAGCSAAQLIPGEIMIPGGLEISAYYSRVNVSSGGIFAGGAAQPVARTPSVRIHGLSQFSVELGTPSATATYVFTSEGLLNPLQPAWTADGDVLSTSGTRSNIRFHIGDATAGQVLTKRVHVRVTDRDNLHAEHEIIVRIHITVPDPGIPIPCRKKPWLPICHPK